VLDVNLKAVFKSAYLALYYFRAGPSTSLKSLVFISSLAGYGDLSWNTTCNAAKFGVRGLWRSLRGGVGDYGIRSNLIAPWFIHTPMTDPYLGHFNTRGLGLAPIEGLVDAAVRCAVDEKIHNRAIAIMPEGNIDLRDDSEGLDAGEELQNIFKDVR